MLDRISSESRLLQAQVVVENAKDPEDLIDVAKIALKKKVEDVLINQEEPIINKEQKYQNQAVESFG